MIRKGVKRVGSSHFLLQGIFPTQGSNPGLLHCRQILNHLNHQGSKRSFIIMKIWEEISNCTLKILKFKKSI